MAVADLGLIRAGRSASVTSEQLGPLADLVGTWRGSQGFVVIATPTRPPGEFRFIARPYVEAMTFTPVGAPVPDRGSRQDSFIAGLMYETRITDLETNEPLHIENGMWLHLGDTEPLPIARQASIPHGDVVLALGSATTVEGVPPDIHHTDARPFDLGPDSKAGYTDEWDFPPVHGVTPRDPNHALRAVIADQPFEQVVTITVSSDSGGILNIPFVTTNANITSFQCRYWLETVKQPAGEGTFQQLQYSQHCNLNFLQQFGGPPGALIVWPHVTVNTLLKQ
jgi:hypothetical protein